MKKTFLTYCDELTDDIKRSYEESITIEQAEKFAAKFLGAMIDVGNELRRVDLDARMKKSGLKTIKAAVYLNAATAGEKKPSDILLGALVDQDKTVAAAQEAFDRAEVEKNNLENYLNVFKEAHIFYRGVSRGKFD